MPQSTASEIVVRVVDGASISTPANGAAWAVGVTATDRTPARVVHA